MKRCYPILLLVISFFLLSVYSSPQGAERLTARESDPKVDPNLILIASDFHIAKGPLARVAHYEKNHLEQQYVSPGAKLKKGEFLLQYDTVAFYKKFIQDVIAMDPRPGAVLFLGDDVQNDLQEEYELMRDLSKELDRAGINYIKIPGNHDRNRELYDSIFPNWKARSVSGADWQGHRVELPAVDFILIQTYDPLRSGYETLFSPELLAKYKNKPDKLKYEGWFLPDQKIWLNKQLEKSGSKPVFLCGHHPIEFGDFFPEYQKYPSLQGWIHGHYHSFYEKKGSNNIRTLSIPSLGVVGIGKDLTPPAYVEMKVSDDGYRFRLVTMDPKNRENGKTFFFSKK